MKSDLLNNIDTNAAESLLQVLSADALRVWTASDQTQHLDRGEYFNMSVPEFGQTLHQNVRSLKLT